MEDIKVSVLCTAYNHEQYIASALNGFVSQITNFKYEVLINDDASTDATAEIIKKFTEQYPDIIKPLLQTENKWSKGISLYLDILLPKAKGKYISICEGDDYWCDPYKLQKQYDYMEADKKCTFCFTNGWIDNLKGNEEKEWSPFIPFSENDKKYYRDENQIITLADTYKMSFIPTASFFFRKDNFNKFPESFYNPCPLGDLKYRLYNTSIGHAYYMKDKTCVYRYNVPNSMMTKWRTSGTMQQRYERSKKTVDMINDVDQFTNFKFQNELKKIKDEHILYMLHNAIDISVFKHDECKRVLKQMRFMDRIYLYIKYVIKKILNR